ncbi:hypothetical protein EPUS_07381 [Endocarpon pusillum Z07020]|uniref:N-acetyltransferase domain-containing protein n=1 Tax=Endocarpon pusillum (strain Z07020 / HMAS-L-300199) TaxID=1263415 RepID=U1GVT2_ENDPU|nr:uncharacterized protein EPUS_07381 [Endocarpon pusillum Z07020]ERF76181.1 hypothetical protein EPUS_07381 [Endocarpon pusillum Z07020]
MSGYVHPLPDGTVTIQTPRLLLRAAQASDAEALHLCFVDTEVMRYWSSRPHKSLEETKEWLAKMVNSKKTNGITDFVITLRDNAPSYLSISQPKHVQIETGPIELSKSNISPAIGKTGIFAPLDASMSGEIGFLLNRSYQGRGFGSEALTAVLRYLFEQKGVETITTDVDPRNGACISLLKKHGFVLTGIAKESYRIGEEWVDTKRGKVDVFHTAQLHGNRDRLPSLSVFTASTLLLRLKRPA